MNSVILVTSSVAFEHKVRRACESRPDVTVARWQSEVMYIDTLQAVKDLAAEGCAVVTLGPGLPVDIALELARVIEEEHPEIAVVLVAEATPELWERALRAGVRDVIPPDPTEADLQRAFDRVLETAARQRHNLADEVGQPSTQGRLITVIAPKGGVGKTFVTTNLAVALAESGAGRVALVDLDLQFGDVADTLALRPENTIGDLATSAGGITPTTLKVFLTPRGENLFVLAAPDSPAAGESVGVATVERALRYLVEDFDFVVVDTSAGLSEAALAAIEKSTDLLFMCDKSVSALRSLRKVIDAIDQLGFVSAARHFVINRADVDSGITSDEARMLVGLPVAAEIPTGKKVALAMNQGEPVVQVAPKSKVGRGLAAVASTFHRPATERGLFRRAS